MKKPEHTSLHFLFSSLESGVIQAMLLEKSREGHLIVAYMEIKENSFDSSYFSEE